MAFHRARWQPQVAALVIAGDITLERAVDLARKALGNWQRGSAAAIPIPPPAPMAADRIYMVDRQGAAQTMIAQILPAPDRKSEDYYALSLADVFLVPQVYNALRFNYPIADAHPTVFAIWETCNTLTPFIDAQPENQPDATG